MRTVILGERPPQIEALIESRRRAGADLYDEVWEGDYHMNPVPRKGHSILDHRLADVLIPLVSRAGLVSGGPFNLGTSETNFRVPDAGIHRSDSNDLFVPTAALVLEILSPHDETSEKLPFYASSGVDEVLIVDPAERTVTWLRRDGNAYRPVEHSELLDVGIAEFAAQIRWPPND